MADHNTPQAVAERIKEWIGRYGGENTATLLLYEAMNALKGTPAAATESVLIDGVAHTVPAAVAAELLSLHLQLLKPAAAVADAQLDLRNALDTLVREAQAVADDYHRPRYTRLDEAIRWARLALSAPQPSGNPGPLAAVDLPPLPSHRFCLNSSPVVEGYTADQMREYARTAIAASKGNGNG